MRKGSGIKGRSLFDRLLICKKAFRGDSRLCYLLSKLFLEVIADFFIGNVWKNYSKALEVEGDTPKGAGEYTGDPVKAHSPSFLFPHHNSHCCGWGHQARMTRSSVIIFQFGADLNGFREILKEAGMDVYHRYLDCRQKVPLKQWGSGKFQGSGQDTERGYRVQSYEFYMNFKLSLP